MITVTENKITIEFEHSCPVEVIQDIREAIIESLQQINYTDMIDCKKVQHSNYFMLELLKQMLEIKRV